MTRGILHLTLLNCCHLAKDCVPRCMKNWSKLSFISQDIKFLNSSLFILDFCVSLKYWQVNKLLLKTIIKNVLEALKTFMCLDKKISSVQSVQIFIHICSFTNMNVMWHHIYDDQIAHAHDKYQFCSHYILFYCNKGINN